MVNNKTLKISISIGIVLGVAGCAATQPQMMAGPTPRVSTLVDPSSRSANQNNRAVVGDFIALAEQVTNKMLGSDRLASWTNDPKVVLVDSRNVINNTDDPFLDVSDISDRVAKVMLDSGLARVRMDDEATEFDYIVESELSSDSNYDGERAIRTYTYKIKLLDIRGDLIGSWIEDIRRES